MKILVANDGDGHFNASPITDKQKCIEVIKSISNGDYYEDVCNKIEEETPNIEECSQEEWESYIEYFIQRNTCEIVTYGDVALDLLSSRDAFFEHVGFIPDWVEYALDFCIDEYWETDGYTIWYGKKDAVVNLTGDHYEDEVYTQRFYKKWIYEGELYTMIFANPGVDGINWFRIFDNNKRVKIND